MSEDRIDFRRFHHLTIAVPELSDAVADWTERLGWAPVASSADHAVFALDDSYLELVGAGPAGPGVVTASVVVDDVEEAASRLKAIGAAYSTTLDGHLLVDPPGVNNVPLELRPEDAAGSETAGFSGGSTAPFRRINHVIVAVADDEGAKASWADKFGAWTESDEHTVEEVHHVPVGIAWFGITSGGTDAGALSRFLERRGEGIYGFALVVDDRPATVAALEGRGAQIVRQESSGQTFIHPKTSHGILVDLVSEARLEK